MTAAKEFIARLANDTRDLLGEFIALLEKHEISYCVIGGLAVNAYAEPVVSLDLDVIIAAKEKARLLDSLPEDLRVKTEEHSVNISASFSDLRIQLRLDNRYQAFIGRGQRKQLLGYNLVVPALENVLQGKLWAYTDREGRASKRQKDLADIMRLVEANQGVVATAIGKQTMEIIGKV